MDLIEQEPRALPSLVTLLSVACVATFGTGLVAVARHSPPPSRAEPVAAEAWSGPRRVPAALLPPDRPRRTSRTQIGPAPPPEVAFSGVALAGPAPGRTLAQRAAYAMAVRLCRDPSLVRLRVLTRAGDWSAVTYYARVYEDPPAHGSFAVALRWTGRAYAYTVTGKAGDCRDHGTG